MSKVYPSLRQKLKDEIDNEWRFAVAMLRKWLRNSNYESDDFEFLEKSPYVYEQALIREF